MRIDETNYCKNYFKCDEVSLYSKNQAENIHFRFLVDKDGEESAKEKIPKYISLLNHLRWVELFILF